MSIIVEFVNGGSDDIFCLSFIDLYSFVIFFENLICCGKRERLSMKIIRVDGEGNEERKVLNLNERVE